MVTTLFRAVILAAVLGYGAIPAIADDLEADGSKASESSDSDWSWSSQEESGSYTDDLEEKGQSDGSCYGNDDVSRC